MLVLTRKKNEIVVISDPKNGNYYEITVIEIQGDQVRLGIVAPRSVAVDRAEIAASKLLNPDKLTV